MTTPPSRLVLIHELPHMQPRSKVRFSGRVSSYDPATGSLTLTAHGPSSVAKPTKPHPSGNTAPADPNHTQFAVTVDATHVLTTAPSHLFSAGAAVSVIGYVVAPSTAPTTAGASLSAGIAALPSPQQQQQPRAAAHVQAVMLWKAGGAATEAEGQAYEEAVAARREAMRAMAEARGGKG